MNCSHTTLKFGSGGYYIFCAELDCGASWIAWKMGEDERVPGVDKGQPTCGSSTMGFRQESNVCARCKGSGEFGLADGDVPCWICGGSGDPNHPGVFFRDMGASSPKMKKGGA